MKIIVYAYQEYGKPIKKPKRYDFCCWQDLDKWLHSVTHLYGCEACEKKNTASKGDVKKGAV